MHSGGLTQRRKAASPSEDASEPEAPVEPTQSNTPLFDHTSENLRFTLLEELILLGIKDSEVPSFNEKGVLSFWNDTISYVLRGAILIELSFRNRITVIKERKKKELPDRNIQVIDEKLTGEVLLDEAVRYIKAETDSIANWIDLLSGKQQPYVR